MIKFSRNESNRKLLNQKVNNGLLIKLYPGIYADVGIDLNLQIAENIQKILEFINIEGIISYESSIDFKKSKTIWIASKSRAKEIKIGNILLNIFKGNEQELNTENTIQLTENLKINNSYRMLLQNFSMRKVDEKKINSSLALNEFIKLMNEEDKISWEIYSVNLLTVSKQLGYEKEASKIIELIKNKNKHIKNADSERLYIFEKLSDYLNLHEFEFQKTLNYIDVKNANQIAFYESYFSNYIEGTEFEIEEAVNIVFNPKFKYSRHKDGNDIIKTYEVIKDNIENPLSIDSPEDLINAIKLWHTKMFKHRNNDMLVGEFKDKPNRAGNTKFVLPEKVYDTIIESFEYSKKIHSAIGKAIYFKVLISEVHPFEDGNGRVSRILMNNMLSLNQKNRIIIPTVFRDDYITSLKAFSQSKDVVPITVALNKAGLISQSIPWDKDVEYLKLFLEDKSAFCEPKYSMWGLQPPKNIEEHESIQLDLFKNLKIK